MRFLAMLGIWLSASIGAWIAFFAAELFAEAAAHDRAAVVLYGFHGHSRGAWLLFPLITMVIVAAALVIANLPAPGR